MAVVEDVFKALGDSTRVRIAEMLARNGEMCVCRIMEELDMTQPAVSHHLATMKRAGLVHARKAGQWVYYSLCRSTLSETALTFIEGLLHEPDDVPMETCDCK